MFPRAGEDAQGTWAVVSWLNVTSGLDHVLACFASAASCCRVLALDLLAVEVISCLRFLVSPLALVLFEGVVVCV